MFLVKFRFCTPGKHQKITRWAKSEAVFSKKTTLQYHLSTIGPHCHFRKVFTTFFLQSLQNRFLWLVFSVDRLSRRLSCQYIRQEFLYQIFELFNLRNLITTLILQNPGALFF